MINYHDSFPYIKVPHIARAETIPRVNRNGSQNVVHVPLVVVGEPPGGTRHDRNLKTIY